MRPSLFLAALFASVALAPTALGVCLPLCETQSLENAGFVPLVSVLTSGETMTWTGTDGMAHTATDRVGFCFHASYGIRESASASFFLADDGLYAYSEGFGDPLFSRCDAATRLPDGSAVLEYECLYHPNMRSAQLVIVPQVI